MTMKEPKLQRAPFDLAAVCQRWRSIALQTPELWASIHMYANEILDPEVYVSHLLQRSAEWPLEIALDYSPDSTPLAIDKRRRIYEMLLAHGTRWRRCHFVLQTPAVLKWVELPKETPVLEEFVLVACSNQQGMYHPEVYNIPAAHHLKRLSLAAIHHPTGSLEHLEYLSINARPAVEPTLWEVLAQAPNLRELRIFWPWTQTRVDVDPPKVLRFPRLETLHLFGHTCTNIEGWVSKLRMPALHTLVVSTYTCYRLGTFFTSVAAHVRTLVLRYEGWSVLLNDDATAVCQLTNLETLIINGRLMADTKITEVSTCTDQMGFRKFIATLRPSAGLAMLKRVEFVDCLTPASFEVRSTSKVPVVPVSCAATFGEDGLGWDDPQIAAFVVESA